MEARYTDPNSQNSPSEEAGQVAVVQLYYTTLYQGLNQVVEIGGINIANSTILNTDDALNAFTDATAVYLGTGAKVAAKIGINFAVNKGYLTAVGATNVGKKPISSY